MRLMAEDTRKDVFMQINIKKQKLSDTDFRIDAEAFETIEWYILR